MKKKSFNYIFYILILLIIFFLSANISYQVFQKGDMVTLPDLTGKTFEEARKELHLLRLSLVKKGTDFNNEWEPGRIISQDPPPKSKMEVNRVVKVTLSAGSEKVIVPSLKGKNLQAINSILHEAGLRRGHVAHTHTAKYAAGRIMAQFPLELKEVPKNTQISLLVSEGEREKKYLMPDLIGKRADVVIKKLKKMGFKIGDIRYSYYPGLEPGIIIKQSPPLGYRILKRNMITLEVSK